MCCRNSIQLNSLKTPSLRWSKITVAQLTDMLHLITTLTNFGTDYVHCYMMSNRYVECTGSAMQGLALFRKLYPKHRRKEIDHCISNAIHYIENTQNPDGSWYCILCIFVFSTLLIIYYAPCSNLHLLYSSRFQFYHSNCCVLGVIQILVGTMKRW